MTLELSTRVMLEHGNMFKGVFLVSEVSLCIRDITTWLVKYAV